VETLQQRKHRRLAAAGRTDETDSLAWTEAYGEIVENLAAVGIAEGDVVELDAGAAADKRLGFRMILQVMRNEQCCHGFRESRDVLGDVDQRDREIPRGAQHGDRQRAG